MNPISLNDAYKFDTFSGFLKQNNPTRPSDIRFSPTCIFCLCPESIPLSIEDGGSLRRCRRCNKNFKAQIILPQSQYHQPQPNHQQQGQLYNYQYKNPYANEPKTQSELNSFNPDAYVPHTQENIYYSRDYKHFSK